MKAAVYARFSSEALGQTDRSIVDQVALCRDYATRRGWVVVEEYTDAGISGASVHGRFAFERMMKDAQRRGVFDVVLSEDLDRLSRNLADVADLYQRMVFAGIEIWTVSDGQINDMHVGLKGTMSAMFLKNLALKTHRGMQGRIRAGRSAGGLCYGYRVTQTGEREIQETEAAIVRRIYQEAAAGDTPRTIVARLNREGIPAPRGGEWNASTLNGMKARGIGILRNELYIGRLIWNRRRWMKNPDTGKREARLNPEGARMTTELPHLRIIDQDLWDKVQRALDARGGAHGPHRQRPKHLLSGLLRCGACQGSFVVGEVKRGVPGFKCSSRKERGTCDNNRTISIRKLERVVLGALGDKLLDERLVETVIRVYAEERNSLLAEASREAMHRTKRLAELGRDIERIIEAIVSMGTSAALETRLRVLEEERAILSSAAAKEEPTPARLDRTVAERYRTLVRDLQTELATRSPEVKQDVADRIRELIEKIEIFPRTDPGGRDLLLYGTIKALLHEGRQGLKSLNTVVAGPRFGQNPGPLTVVIPVQTRAVIGGAA